MITKKQNRSLEQVFEVYKFFFAKISETAFFADSSEAVYGASKLTQVYFDSHEADGSPCGEFFSYDLNDLEEDYDN